MIRFRSGFISRQTGDGCKKPETESLENTKVKKVEKVVVREGGKWKIIVFPCGS